MVATRPWNPWNPWNPWKTQNVLECPWKSWNLPKCPWIVLEFHLAIISTNFVSKFHLTMFNKWHTFISNDFSTFYFHLEIVEKDAQTCTNTNKIESFWSVSEGRISKFSSTMVKSVLKLFTWSHSGVLLPPSVWEAMKSDIVVCSSVISKVTSYLHIKH